MTNTVWISCIPGLPLFDDLMLTADFQRLLDRQSLAEMTISASDSSRFEK
jgi:hypothetical protein